MVEAFAVAGVYCDLRLYLAQKIYLSARIHVSCVFPISPLGLSYIFFRVLHLLIEGGDSRGRRRIGLGAYLLYTVNFTTFVSGPIQRYDEFARDQFAAEPIPLGPRVIGPCNWNVSCVAFSKSTFWPCF